MATSNWKFIFCAGNLGVIILGVCVESVVLGVIWKTEKVGSTSFFIIKYSAHSPTVQHLCTRHTWASIVAPPRVRHPSGENTWGNGELSKLYSISTITISYLLHMRWWCLYRGTLPPDSCSVYYELYCWWCHSQQCLDWSFVHGYRCFSRWLSASTEHSPRLVLRSGGGQLATGHHLLGPYYLSRGKPWQQ